MVAVAPAVRRLLDRPSADYVSAKLTVAGSTKQDLEYACIFPLPQDLPPKDCKANQMQQLPCDCSDWDPKTSKNPLCAIPVDPNDRAVGTYGSYDPKLLQYRAKAYPGTRYLHVLKAIGAKGVAASICAANTSDASRADYGFKPVIEALTDAAAARLTQK